MNLFNSDYNKRKNHFDQGITMIRNRNNRFFLNAQRANSIYDLADINSYFSIEQVQGKPELTFRNNTNLPDLIRKDITTLFNEVWEAPAVS